MKALLKLFVFTSIIVFIAVSCQKILSNEDPDITARNEFNSAAVKNWYYGTFVKTTEWAASPEKEKKLPDWKNGTPAFIGKWNAIEYPLVKARSSFSVPGGNALTAAQCKRIADASLSKIVFIKKEDGQVMVREINYIPDWQYLQDKQFNIGELKSVSDKNDFTGRMIIKRWDGSTVSSQMLVDGKTIKLAKKDNGTKNNGTNSLVTCTSYEYCIWQEDCEINIYNDGVFTTECGPWYNTGDCWSEMYCTDDGEGDPCGTYGCNPPPEENQCNMTVADANAALAAITYEETNTVNSTLGTPGTPDASGIIRAPKNSTGGGARLNIAPGYTPYYEAQYTGVVYKTTSNSQWKWESFAYSNNFVKTSGDLPPCFSATATATVSTTISSDKLTATAVGNVNIIVTISCLNGMQAATHSGSFTAHFPSN